MSRARTRIGVLISGSGTNLQALLDRAADGTIPGEVALVLSNKEDAHGLERARKAGAPTAVVRHKDFPTREAFDARLVEALRGARVDLVCLAGFMRVLTPAFIRAFEGRILNIHPALLPAFPGVHAQKQAFDYGVRWTGATVHFVDEGTDTGPIVLQAAVPVLPEDDLERLSARILAEEHRIYPEAVRLFCEGRLRIEGRKVRILE
ncbi:MAG: phosphoribosylglycinamide formyltransferase [Candidatus Methylomirabilis sp.]|nr:phosphoribosylglycinamide formyltransferase [Deltaproteobacteria bacterium]